MTTALDLLTRLERDAVNFIDVFARLILGNYCTLGTATASSADADFPASGAIDGNRTELSETINGAGLNIWKSTAAPAALSPETLTIDLGQARRANFFKVYFMEASRPLTWMLSVSDDDVTYRDLGATSDIGDVTVRVPLFTVVDTGSNVVELRVADDRHYQEFRYIQLTIWRMTNPTDVANCVELECYRKLDITDRVRGVSTSADFDYKLENLLASTARLTVDNRDKYFSIDYVPRTREAVADFVNDELKPGIGLEILAGRDPVSNLIAAGSTGPTTYDPALHVTPEAATPPWDRPVSVGMVINTEDASTGVLLLDTTSAGSTIRDLSYVRDYSALGLGDYLQMEVNSSNWGLHTDTGRPGGVMEMRDSTGNDWGIGLFSDGIYTGTTVSTDLVYAMDCTGAHTYKMLLIASNQCEIYVDGVLRGTIGVTFSLGVTDALVRIGFRGTQTCSIGVVVYSDIIVVLDDIQAFDEGAVHLFTGKMDRISINPGAREAALEFRDSFREMIKKEFSAAPKFGEDIGAIIQYLLNVANVSNYEMDIDDTAILLDYFFTTQEKLLDTSRNLVAACGDASLYFDEFDRAAFKMFMVVALESILSSTAEFDAGVTKQNVATWDNKLQRKWFLIDDFADGDFTSDPVWTTSFVDDEVVGNLVQAWAVASNVLDYTLTLIGTLVAHTFSAIISTPFTKTSGTWRYTLPSISSGDDFLGSDFFIMAINASGGVMSNGYYARVDRLNGSVAITRDDVGVGTVLAQNDVIVSPGELGQLVIDVERDPDGVMRMYVDGSLAVTTSADVTYTTSAYCGVQIAGGIGGHSGMTTVSTFHIDDIQFSNSAGEHASTYEATQGVYETDWIDQGIFLTSEGTLEATMFIPSGTSVDFFTQTSADMTPTSYDAATIGSDIPSTPLRYLKIKVVFNSPQDSAGNNADARTAIVFDITANWNAFAGSDKVPASSTHTFRWDDVVKGIEQELTDTVGGDSVIANYITVNSSPIVLSGADADLQWDAVTQVPPVPISVTAPVQVAAGDVLTYRPILTTPMDVSLMSGADPAAAVITFGEGGAGTWEFSRIHPTRPVLVLTITTGGTITRLSLTGKTYGTSTYGISQVNQNDDSINEFGVSPRTVDSPWIQQNSLARTIAAKIAALFPGPLYQLSNCVLRFTPTVKRGDRVTVVDDNTAIALDFLVAGISHDFSVTGEGAEASTTLRLFRIS